MKKTVKTTGILLKKTWLANDDAVLDIFTAKLGRVAVFAGKLARSKKRQLELDFFRLLEIDLEEGKSSYRLRSVSTQLWFGRLSSEYTLSKNAFQVFENLRAILPEEKALPEFFSLSCTVLSAATAQTGSLWLAFWEVKALEASGVCPRFDSVRGDMWWEFESFECFDTEIVNGVYVPHDVRQLLEFLRRTPLTNFAEKVETLPKALGEAALSILQKMSEYH